MFFFDVVKLLDDRVIFLSHNDGLLHSNKGIHTTGTEIEVPPLLDVDLELIEIAKDEEVDLLGLSFVHNAEDVKMCLGYIEGTSIRMVTKIVLNWHVVPLVIQFVKFMMPFYKPESFST